jgi:hypothetical protein
VTDVNHRRPARPIRPEARPGFPGRNGYISEAKSWGGRRWASKGRTDLLQLSDRAVGAWVGHHFSEGHRGAARATLGAKKFIRSRTRFHENAAARALALEAASEVHDEAEAQAPVRTTATAD